MKIASVKKFLSNEVLNIPLSIPLSATIGYNICGVKCATVATATSILDLMAKGVGVSDSYYLTFSSMGGYFGKNMATFITDSYQTPREGESSHFSKIQYLDILLPACVASLGIVSAQVMNTAEHYIVSYGAQYDVQPELMHPATSHEHLEV